mmetsp:Transcript_11270/g.11315  ORF Transcript_11270/g.11315 Transcript_11270/m.11315 type:complete len:81 (-) Transcript_11270:533-775(-)
MHDKKEALVFYIEKEKELSKEFFSLIEQIQEDVNPEVSILFYNGTQKTFSKDVEERIDSVLQNYFLEYIKEDLPNYVPKN